MNSGDPNKAEIELDVSGDAVEQAKELAKQLDAAADAEQRLQKEMAKRARVLSSLDRQKQQERRREFTEERRAESRAERHAERQRVQADRQRAAEERRARYTTDDALVRRRVDSIEQSRRVRERLDAAGYGRAAPRTVQQEAERRIQAAQREERVRQAMGRIAPQGGITGIAQRAEGAMGLQPGALSGLATRARGMVGPAAGMAAFATAGKFAIDGAVTVNDQLQHGSPYADGFTRERELFGNLPLSREFYAVKDLATGRAKAMDSVNRRRIVEDVRAPVRFEAMQVQADLARERRAAELNAQSVRHNRLPDFPGGERRTLSQQQGYQLAQRLLPLQEQMAEASTARAEAENAVTAAQERQQKMAEERQMIVDRIERTRASSAMLTKSGAISGGDPVYLERLNNVARDTGIVADFDRQAVAARMELKQREEAAARARYQQSAAGSQLSAARLADLQQREQVAGSQAERLTLMGAEGRLRGQYAMTFAKSYGIGMMPQELISAGMAYGGDEFRAMAREEGERNFVPEARPFAPQEYRDSGADIRSQVDAAGRSLQQARQADREAGADDLLRAAEMGGDKVGDKLKDVIEALYKRIEKRLEDLVEYRGQEGGYRQPRS